MFGEMIKSIRIEKKLTQQQLSEILGFKHPSSIGMIEVGKRDIGVEKIILLANYLNVSCDYLMGRVPFKNETEAYHSISIASAKYLRDYPLIFPSYLQKKANLHLVYENENKHSNDIKAYCEQLISKYKNNLSLSDIELFELSNILFSSIKWSTDYSGPIYLQPYNKEFSAFPLVLDFKNMDKITLDLSKSILINYISNNSTYINRTSVLDNLQRVLNVND